MESPIENLGSLPSLESLEKSMQTLQGVLTDRRVEPTAQNETKALFRGYRDSLGAICNNIIANSDSMSVKALENSFTQINRIFTVMGKVGENLSEETKSVADQVDTLFLLVEAQKKKL